jgi:hypothetical protein
MSTNLGGHGHVHEPPQGTSRKTPMSRGPQSLRRWLNCRAVRFCRVRFVAFILSSILGSHAIARDSQEALRDALTICNQFLIEDPDLGVVLRGPEPFLYF